MVHIRRWSNEYLVPREHLAPEDARSRLDRIGESLTSDLAAGIAPWAAEQPDAVLVIERLEFECQLDLDRDSRLLAARWAEEFARALTRAASAQQCGFLSFPSQAAFRAQFISDLAAGRAWHLWYYRVFRGLERVPVASAIRTLLAEDAALGRATLVLLSPRAWTSLDSALTRIEALRIMDALSVAGDSGGLDESAFRALLPDLEPDTGSAWFVRALSLFAAALKRGLAPNPALAAFARIAAKLPRMRLSAHWLAAAIARRDIGALTAADPEHDPETWAVLGAYPQSAGALADAVAPKSAARRPAEGESAEPLNTAFGGFALLLPELDALLAAAAPPFPRSTAAWLVLANCAGAAGCAAFLNDSAWRDFFGIPSATGLSDVRAVLEGVDAAPASGLLGEHAARQARGEPAIAPFDAERRVILDDATRIWLRFPPRSSDRESIPSRLDTARLAHSDRNYLDLGWDLPEAWRLFFLHAAQIVLRRFAYRMPGCAASTLVYVRANLLAGAGQWDQAAGYLTLSRPPLFILLQLTGVSRESLRWPGPPARAIRLEFQA